VIRLGSAALAAALVSAALVPDAGAHAQGVPLRAQCAAAASSAVEQFCVNVADATTILQPRIGIGFSGGNPVPGSSSTMGMRLGTMPRMSLGLRLTAAAVGLPPIEQVGRTADLTFPVGSVNADAGLGIYQGLTLLPTVGGFGSLDLIGSAGIMPLPRGSGFDDATAASWALGARVGLLRESFTAPGVSIDVMYRSVGRMAWGSPELADRDAFVQLDRMRVTSVQGTVGKRMLGFGLTGGASYDRYRGDVAIRIRDSAPLEIAERGVTTSRTSLYGNVSLTVLILNLASELGWQQGGDAIQGATDRLQKGGLFGGLAVRLAI
jgi:hypothetical protein